MSDDKPHDNVLQQQLEYLSHQARKATNSKTIIIVSVNGDDGENIQASVQMAKPESREAAIVIKGQAGRALIIVAGTVLEKDTGGKFQLMIKKPNGELRPALDPDIERFISERAS